MATRQYSRRGAAERGISDEASAAASGGPIACGPCRGTGKLLSSAATGPELGEPHVVSCPWCDGTGTSIPERDAQDHPAETPPVLNEAEQEQRAAALAAREAASRSRRTAARKPAARKPAARKKPASKSTGRGSGNDA